MKALIGFLAGALLASVAWWLADRSDRAYCSDAQAPTTRPDPVGPASTGLRSAEEPLPESEERPAGFLDPTRAVRLPEPPPYETLLDRAPAGLLQFSETDSKLRRLLGEALDRHRVPLAHRSQELLDLADGWGLVPEKAWIFLDPGPALDLVTAAILDGVRIRAPVVDEGGAVAWYFPEDRELDSLRVRLYENWMGDQRLEVLDVDWTLGEWALQEPWPLKGEFQLELGITSYRGASGSRFASFDLQVKYDGMERRARVGFELNDEERTLELCSPGLDSRHINLSEHPDLATVFERLLECFAIFHEAVVPLMVR